MYQAEITATSGGCCRRRSFFSSSIDVSLLWFSTRSVFFFPCVSSLVTLCCNFPLIHDLVLLLLSLSSLCCHIPLIHDLVVFFHPFFILHQQVTEVSFFLHFGLFLALVFSDYSFLTVLIGLGTLDKLNFKKR